MAAIVAFKPRGGRGADERQVHTGVGVPEQDRASALRRARYCARNPVALERLSDAAEADRVTYNDYALPLPIDFGAAPQGEAREGRRGSRVHSAMPRTVGRE